MERHFPPALPPLPRERFSVSVVLPVFSETKTVGEVIGWLSDHLGGALLEVIIVLSPRSTTASREACDRIAAGDPRIRIHVQQVNPGLGNAVREGYRLTRGNLVLTIDSDGEMENETVLRMLDEFATGKPAVVLASRWIPGGGFAGYSKVKLVLNLVFQNIFRVLYRTRLHDLTYGFKMMRGELARGIAWTGTMHEIACETTFAPLRLGYTVAEVPTRWTRRVEGASKNTFLRTFRYFGPALRILFRRPGIVDKEG